MLHAWAMNLMVQGVSTRKYGRATRLPATVQTSPASKTTASRPVRKTVAKTDNTVPRRGVNLEVHDFMKCLG